MQNLNQEAQIKTPPSAPSHKEVYTYFVGTGVPDCPQIELTKYGKIADKYIKQLKDFYNHLSVEESNHIHLLFWVKENKNAIENGQSRTPVPTNIERVGEGSPLPRTSDFQR